VIEGSRTAEEAYNLRFPGQYFDSETGKHYNYFRDYDPTLGRYIESDPLGIDAGLNTYSYVQASPVAFSDDLGLDRNVFFLDGGGSGIYGASVYVYDDQTGDMFGPYKGSTEPDQSRKACTKGCPQVSEGRFSYKPGLFPSNPRPNQTRYRALRLGTVPSLAPNPNNGGRSAITGTWVHRGGRSSTGSEGCLTIDPLDWADFISRFPKGTSGYVEVVR
jgi:RHS repeat-associated protein